MQINGVNEFLSRISSLTGAGGARGNAFLPGPAGQGGHDTLFLSDIGKRLSFGVDKAPLLDATRKTNKSDPILSLMDKSMSAVEEILGKMHELAVKARDDKSLSDLDRINMQIQMEDLRTELANASNSMNTKFAKMSGYDEKIGEAGRVICPLVEGDSRSVLERARDRIMNGEKWDVAEGVKLYQQVSLVRHGDNVIGKNEDGKVVVDWPENAVVLVEIEPGHARSEFYTLTEDERITPNGEAMPTVSEKLRATDTIVLLDSKSAAEGVKRLEMEMDKLKAAREELNAFKADAKHNGMGMSKLDLQVLMHEYAQRQQADTEKDSGKEEKRAFVTELGIMEISEGLPKLVNPTSEKGALFAKLENIFGSIAGNLTKTVVDNVGSYVTSVVPTNLEKRFSEAA
jgi:hypothetical protein